MNVCEQIEHQLEAEIDPAFRKRASILLKSVAERRPESVLDAGCGRGYYLHRLSQYPFIERLVGVDLESDRLDTAKQQAESGAAFTTLKASLTKLPFEAESFDFILCSEVLEHIPDDNAALTELVRVLKPGGTLAVTVPNEHFPFLWDPLNWMLMRLFGTHVSKDIHWLAGIWADHERLYTKETLQGLISAKLSIDSCSPIIQHCVPFAHFLFYGIGKNLVLRLGIKRFSRFSTQGQGWMPRLIAKWASLPSDLLDPRSDHANAQNTRTGVNLVMLARKI